MVHLLTNQQGASSLQDKAKQENRVSLLCNLNGIDKGTKIQHFMSLMTSKKHVASRFAHLGS